MLVRLITLSCLLVASAFVLAPAGAEAKCARVYLQPYVATPDDTVLPIEGGAILVGLNGRMDGKEDMAELPTSFTMVKGKKRIELRLEPLAPGFGRLVPTEKPTAGKWKVEGVLSQLYNKDGKYDVATVTFGDGTLSAPPAAPAASTASLTHERYGRGRMSIVVSATLTSPAPKEAVYVLSSWAETPDPSRGGAFMVNVEGDQLIAFRNRGRCSSTPTGESAPSGGSKAVIRWVDAYGQVSAPSAPFEVVDSSPDQPIKAY